MLLCLILINELFEPMSSNDRFFNASKHTDWCTAHWLTALDPSIWSHDLGTFEPETGTSYPRGREVQQPNIKSLINDSNLYNPVLVINNDPTHEL